MNTVKTCIFLEPTDARGTPRSAIDLEAGPTTCALKLFSDGRCLAVVLAKHEAAALAISLQSWVDEPDRPGLGLDDSAGLQ